ncbi:peptidyl-tRNA hydrolase [Citrus sinensis]|nr:peptidyl-tRNA hydrolase [Citrus sinensis]
MKFANTLTASISAVRFPNIHHSIRFPLKHSPLCCWGRRTRMSRSPSNSTIRNFSSSISNEESLVSPKPKQQQQHPWLIVGLGNPGKQYNGTRHNVGFEMVDAIAEAEGISVSSVNFKAHFGKGFIGNVPVMLAKPQTFMNASGQSVGSIVSYYKIPLKQVLVIFDDLDLPFSKMRLLPKGGHGGHNGFAIMFLGIGRPPGKMDSVNFVLRPFSKQERQELDFTFQQGVEAVRILLLEGFNKAATFVNTAKPMEQLS